MLKLIEVLALFQVEKTHFRTTFKQNQTQTNKKTHFHAVPRGCSAFKLLFI